MQKSIISSAVLAAVLACSPLAVPMAHAQAKSTSTAPMHEHSRSDAHTTHHVHRMHDMHKMHRMHRRGHFHSMFKKLDLTDAQRASIRQWMKQDFAKARADMKALNGKRMALRNATPGTAAYEQAAKALAEASANAASARVLHRADQRAKIYGLLTPAQRGKLADLRAQRKARMDKWRKAHPHHRAPAPATSSASR